MSLSTTGRRLIPAFLTTLVLCLLPSLRAQDTGAELSPVEPRAVQPLQSIPTRGTVPTQEAQQSSTTLERAGDATGGEGSSAAAVGGRDYVIGPEDLLDIGVFSMPELSGTVRVSNDGTITLPLLGRVAASGYTSEQLRENLQRLWSRTYLNNPDVTVFVKEFHARPVSVIGAVEKPGLYYLTGQRTLIEMISMAGGLAKRPSQAPGRDIIVTRKDGFKEFLGGEGISLVHLDQVQIDLRRLINSHDESLNIEIKPSDVISVSKADIVYVIGSVNREGGYVLEERPTVTILEAIAMAAGLKSTASKKNGRIIRTSESGQRTEIPVDVAKVLKGTSPDLLLSANDILYVPDSASKAALKRGAEAIVATLSGVIVFSSSR